MFSLVRAPCPRFATLPAEVHPLRAYTSPRSLAHLNLAARRQK